MEWSYDKDESLHFPASESTDDEQAMAPTVHPFFTGAAAPVQIVGSACHSVFTHCLLVVSLRLCLMLQTKLTLHQKMLVESARYCCPFLHATWKKVSK